MDARLQDLPFDPGTLKGLSEKLTRSHHQNNYGGAVTACRRGGCQFLRGGIDGWKSAGRPLASKPS